MALRSMDCSSSKGSSSGLTFIARDEVSGKLNKGKGPDVLVGAEGLLAEGWGCSFWSMETSGVS
jgi:hypothetical protein